MTLTGATRPPAHPWCHRLRARVRRRARGRGALRRARHRRFGLRVTIVEPGPYGTGWLDADPHSDELPAYDAVRAAVATDREIGVARATRAAILQLADADKPRLRSSWAAPLAGVTRDHEARLATWREWQPVSEAAF